MTPATNWVFSSQYRLEQVVSFDLSIPSSTILLKIHGHNSRRFFLAIQH